MACPNYEVEVQLLADAHPDAWKNAHTGNAHTEDFIRLVAAELHVDDARVGLNGKRGNPDDLSDDALNILDPDDGPGTTPDGQRCWVVDIIAGAGGPTPSVTWNAFSDPESSTGAWVNPGARRPSTRGCPTRTRTSRRPARPTRTAWPPPTRRPGARSPIRTTRTPSGTSCAMGIVSLYAGARGRG